MKLKKYLALACASVLAVLSTAEFNPNAPALIGAGEKTAIVAQAAETASPCFYGDKVIAKPGDKHVPCSFCILKEYN